MNKSKLTVIPLPKGATAARQTITPPESDPAGNTLAANYVMEVMGACRMVGRPELAEKFIAKRISLEAVRGALLHAQAQADEAMEIVGTPPPAGAATRPTLQSIDEDAIFAARRKHMTGSAQEDESLS